MSKVNQTDRPASDKKGGDVNLSLNELKILSSLKGDDKYGLQIKETINKADSIFFLGSLYNILRRLEKNGLVISYWDEGTEDRGGNRRRYYSLTGKGALALESTQSALLNLWGMTPI